MIDVYRILLVYKRSPRNSMHIYAKNYTSVDPKYYLVGAQSSGMIDGIEMCIFFYILQEGVLGHKKLRRHKLYRRSCKDAFSAADGSVEMAVNFPELFLASLSVPITLLLFPASLFGCCFEKACDFVPLKLDFQMLQHLFHEERAFFGITRAMRLQLRGHSICQTSHAD